MGNVVVPAQWAKNALQDATDEYVAAYLDASADPDSHAKMIAFLDADDRLHELDPS